MAEEGNASNVVEATPPKHKVQEKVYESALLKSVSKTGSVSAFIENFGVDILVYGLVYLAGQRRAAAYWLIPPIAFLVAKDLWTAERDKRKFDDVIKTLRDEDKELILADANRLPPWVHYPDIERCNWLNKLMAHFWPYICNAVSDIITNKIEPAVTKSINGLTIRKVSLGTVPPIVSGVKVYDHKVSISHLLIDANLCYSGDCELSLSYRGIPVGVENVQLRGPVRLDFLIIQTLPFFGGVEFSFIGLPQIDFVLTGVGSLGFTEETVRQVINSQISAHLVFPNKVGKVWSEEPADSMTDPEGVIRLNVIEAKDLESHDSSVLRKNLSDPYAEVTYGSKTFCSRVIDESSNPNWDLWCEFIQDKNQTVNIKLMDEDPTRDDLIGTYSLSVSELKKQKKMDSWVKLEGSKGTCHIRAYFQQMSSDVKHLKSPPHELSFLSSYVLIVLVKSAHNLMLPRGLKKPSSIVKMTVGNDTQETKMVENTDSPLFDQVFNFFVNNPDFNKLRVKVVDDNKSEIGSFSYSLRKLLDRKNLEIDDQHFPLLDSAGDSSVVVSMRLRIIKNVF